MQFVFILNLISLFISYLLLYLTLKIKDKAGITVNNSFLDTLILFFYRCSGKYKYCIAKRPYSYIIAKRHSEVSGEWPGF